MGGAALSALFLIVSRVLVPHLSSTRATPPSLLNSADFRLYFWIGIGSGLGGIARFWCGTLALRLLGPAFPWGTLGINVLGSFVIGLFAALTGPDGLIPASTMVRQFVMAGICGGYTTFSAFSLQTLTLMNDGAWIRAAGNIGLSVVLCLTAVWVGHALAASLNGAKLLP